MDKLLLAILLRASGFELIVIYSKIALCFVITTKLIQLRLSKVIHAFSTDLITFNTKLQKVWLSKIISPLHALKC